MGNYTRATRLAKPSIVQRRGPIFTSESRAARRRTTTEVRRLIDDIDNALGAFMTRWPNDKLAQPGP